MPMIDFLETVFEHTGVLSDSVFSGHVQNYQRLSESNFNGKQIPHIVAGAGDYANLHRVSVQDDDVVNALPSRYGEVDLVSYCADRFGF